jgi:cyclohexyl-isocyanide hydratase
MTMLDFIGPYDPLTRLESIRLMPEFAWEICAMSKDIIDDKELCVIPTVVGRSLSDYDLLVVPGG